MTFPPLLKPLNTPIRDWRGKRVWLVGASTGIGAALARDLAARSAILALSARSLGNLETVAKDCGPQSLIIPIDVTLPDDFPRARDEILSQWAGIDLVIFNAGTYNAQRAWELSPEAIRQTIDTNLVGTLNGLAAITPQLCAQKSGAIALVASVAGYGGLPKAAVYGPSKAALINLAEVLYLDLAPRGISVFLINPGFVATPLTAQNDFSMPALQTPEQAAEAIIAGFGRGAFEIHFPRRFSAFLKALQWLPRRAYFALIHRITGL